jgi:hypothetical protein
LLLPTPAAWSLSLILKVLLAATFTAAFLLEIGASISGAVLAGVSFAFGGFMTAWLGWPHTDSSLWLPLACLQVHRLCRKPSPRSSALLALILAMPIFAGHPGMAAHVLAAVAAYGVWIVVTREFRNAGRQVLWLAIAAGIALGIAAVQLLPTAQWLGQIDRTLDARWGSLPFFDAVEFFSRDGSSNPNSADIAMPLGAVYAGALPLLLSVFALLRPNKRAVLFFTGVFAISFCVVYGVEPITRLSQRVPILKGLKKEEGLLLTDFALAVLAGLGASCLEKLEWKRLAMVERVGIWIVLVLATATFHEGTAVLSKMTEPGVEWWRSPRSFRVLLVVSAFVIVFRILQILSRRQWVVVTSVLVATDLLSFSYAHIPFNVTQTIFPNIALFNFLAHQSQPFRVVPLNAVVSPNAESLYGLSTAGGYDFMLRRVMSMVDDLIQPPRFLVYFEAERVAASRARILDMLNVRYLIATPYNESLSIMRRQPARFREVWSSDGASVFENTSVLPRAFLVPATRTETIESEEAQLLRVKDSSFDPAYSVILEAPVPSAATADDLQPKVPGSVDQFREDVNWVWLHVSATTPSILILSQIYYPGWSVYVDGKRADLLRPDYALTGTFVGAGSHTVEFRFLPPTFTAGAIVSLLSLGLVWRLSGKPDLWKMSRKPRLRVPQPRADYTVP